MLENYLLMGKKLPHMLELVNKILPGSWERTNRKKKAESSSESPFVLLKLGKEGVSYNLHSENSLLVLNTFQNT